MKIDRAKIKRSTTEVPPDCKILIDKLKGCCMFSEMLAVLKTVESWTYGKSELYHWIDVLDLFDSVLGKATEKSQDNWTMHCDTTIFVDLYECVIHILQFTTLLIEHSFSRHLYNSMEHLTTLLTSSNLKLVLEVLQLLYMFSKRSNFLTRLPEDKREVLLERLTYLAESWGGKEAGFGLAACCQDLQLSAYPSTATSVHLEFIKTIPSNETGPKSKLTDVVTVVHMDEIHMQRKSIQVILKELCTTNDIPPEKQVVLLTHIRLAYFFPYWSERILCVQARLQALSVLVYANAIQDNIQQLLYSGLMEELVDILELEGTYLTDIKAAALRTLTSIIHLDRAQNFPNIIDATGAGSYHGFLPMMVRSCIAALTSPTSSTAAEQYPLPLATALFSFLYHLASYELGGEALVNCGMLESLLKVVNWNTTDVEHITFVTRAVRVIDLITNMDMQAFQAHNGLTSFINRLEMEVNACRREQPFEIIPEISIGSRQTSNSGGQEGSGSQSDRPGESNADAPMDTDSSNIIDISAGTSSSTMRSLDPHSGSAVNFIANGLTCLPQRAALLKSMLNFLKKVIQDPAFSDSIRHIMEGSLPASLKHLISNAEYYGASLFLLATDVVTVYVFQEPSLLSTLQDSGLTDVVSEALLVKDVPPTREVISSMPNVFSALCLNSRGLNAFVRCNPFQRLFKVLLSPEYLPAMRRRRTAEPMGDTASNLGNAMDELMRHQPSLKVDATTAIVQLLEELCAMGRDFRYSCWKPQAKPVVSTVNTNPRNGTSEGGSSEEEEDDDEEASTASHPQPVQHAVILGSEHSNQANPSFAGSCLGNSGEEKTPVPLVDYILNVMKFVDAILSNNSTDDHCREFVAQSGLAPLMTIFSLPNLPIDFPNSPACQAVSSVCKSILNLAHEAKVLQEGMNNLEKILTKLEVLNKPIEDPGSSVLLRELADSTVPSEAVGNNAETPILHMMTAAHAYVMMFIHVCRTGQSDIRAMSISNWGSPQGLRVLQNLSQLYLNLVWESTVLLALCSGEFQPGPNEFGRMDLDNLIPPDVKLKETEVSIKTHSEANSSPSSLSIPSQPSDSQLSLPADEPIDSSEQEGFSVSSIRRVADFPMEVDNEASTSTSSLNPLLVHSSTQTQSRSERSANLTLQNYAKLIKPILSASSRLGRALAELFGLLVKLCVGSPLRQRRGHHMPTLPAFVTPGATAVAKVLAELLTSGLRWKPKPNSPVPRLTFSVCAVGFSAPLLFDEKKFPYHLMLKKFMDTGGLGALFEVFYWAMSKEANLTGEEEDGKDTLSEHQIEFLDSWLLLVEKFVSPKTVTESPHTLPTKISVGQRAMVLDTQSFLGHVHKMSFEAVMYLWKRIPMKNYGTRAVESMLAILCHILRYKEQKKAAPKPTEETPSTSRTYRELGRIGPVFIRVVSDENPEGVPLIRPRIAASGALEGGSLAAGSIATGQDLEMATPAPSDALPLIRPRLVAAGSLEEGDGSVAPDSLAARSIDARNIATRSLAPGPLSSGQDLEMANPVPADALPMIRPRIVGSGSLEGGSGSHSAEQDLEMANPTPPALRQRIPAYIATGTLSMRTGAIEFDTIEADTMIVGNDNETMDNIGQMDAYVAQIARRSGSQPVETPGPSSSENATPGMRPLGLQDPGLAEIVPLPSREFADGEARGEISNESVPTMHFPPIENIQFPLLVSRRVTPRFVRNHLNQRQVIPAEDVDPELRALIEQSNGELEAEILDGVEPVQPSGAPAQSEAEPQGEPGAERATPMASGERTSQVPITEEVMEAARQRGVHPLNVQQLVDMGFPLERCVEALASTSNLLQATDFLLNSLAGETPEGASRPVAQPPVHPPVPTSSRARLTGHGPGVVMEWDDNEEEQMLRAIAMSLGEPTVKLQTIAPGESQTPLEDHTMAKELLKPEEVDLFTETVLDQCLSIIDQLPESVFRVCELLVAVGQRNGIVWIKNTLYGIGREIKDIISKMWKLGRNRAMGNHKLEYLCDPHADSDGSKLATRVHLFSLIFEELKDECAELFENFVIIVEAEFLIQTYAELATAEPKNPSAPTPKWLAPLILLIDLYEKTAIASRRRSGLFEETDNVWKWFDINSGKWCTYSTQNNMLIDSAFWNGECSVRITAGRRRYVINFNGMIQLNEETSNRRPITLWLKKLKPGTPIPTAEDQVMDGNWTVSDSESEPVANALPNTPSATVTPPPASNTEESKAAPAAPRAANAENPKSVVVCKTFLGLTKKCIASLVVHCVKLMSIPVEPETLHAVMRLCLRLTRHHDIAVIFAQHGGVHQLLTLNQGSGFAGFLPLANLLIRHVIEDPACLKYAIEKMMRAKALSTGASTCKELHYLLRVLAPVACRNPGLFVTVAKDILRVDMGFVTRRAEEDMRLIVKPVPCKSESLKTFMGECARGVIQQLLVALTLHHPSDDDVSNPDKKAAAAAARQANTNTQTQQQEIDEQMDTDNKSQKEKDTKNEANELQKKKLLIPKYAICQLLAESVHSYSYSCKIIAEYSLQAGTSPYVPEDCTALAFLLDRMLPSNQYVGEKDCSAIVRDLVSAMAGCNHLPEAQAIVISEVKAALQRALAMRECADKHSRIQALAGLICTMIESCPSAPPTQMVSAVKTPQLCMNQAVRLLIRKSVVVDLARIPHNLDLSSTHMAATVNAALKPLEVISRIVNQPVNVAIRTGGKPKNDAAQPESVNNTHTEGGTSNSDGTHAQGEDTVEDADNTEHDISAAAESLLDATSESHTHEHEHNEERDDELEEIMDQLLDRDNNQGEEILGDALIVETSGNRMDTEQEQNQRGDRDFNNTTFEDVHDHNDTSDSDSDPSDGEEDGEEDGNANDAGDDDDEDDDEDEDEEEDDEAGSNFDDRDPEMIEEGFIRFPGMDREEDMLMVQYGGDPENAPVFFTNNTSYNLNMGLFDDPLISEHSSGLRSSHPLLTPPMSDPPVTGTVTTRGHRTGRQRRYQYIQFNPRHPHPPAILQRLLGPSTAQEVIQLTTGQALNQGIRDARLLVMDASTVGILNNGEDDQLDLLDQAINRNGPAGTSGCLANYTALHWWCEEAKALDGESMHDCVVAIKRDIVEAVEQDRDRAFQARREKRLKEEEAKKKATSNKAAGTDSMPPNIEPDVANQNVAATEANSSEAPNLTTEEPTTEPRTSGEGAAASNSLDSYLGARPATATGATLDQEEEKEDSDEEMDMEAAIDEVFDGTISASSRVGEERLRRYLFEDTDVTDLLNQDPPSTGTQPPEAPAAPASTDAAPSGEASSANAEAADPIPGPSGTQTNEDFKSILGDIDIPEGVDPSFLAALPEDMRQEVIAEHLRAQRPRQRSQSTTAQEITPVNVVDVSPEFLAALPPNIQEEVLAQQRIEQQRRVATASNPNDPVDAEAFFRNLQPALRQVIMSDMEESQLAVLPPDLAAEAQNLRREWETRNRQLLQDRFFPHNHHASTTLSSILRNSGMRLSSRYALANVAQRAQWPNQWPRPAPALLPATSLLNCKFKGKQLVDHETLSCLLVLLFVDEPRLNTGRLHRVLRNLCYHATTRQWVIKSLLSVMERANDCTLSNYQSQAAIEYPGGSHRELETYHAPSDKKSHFQFQAPSWLNISLDAALGCRANVFQIQRTGSSSKKGGSENRHISIHAQAVPPICRHTLDVLSNLAKSFPTHFLPTKAKTSLLCLESGSKILNNEKETTPADAAKARNASVSSTGKGNKATESPMEFWDLLLKLDTATSSRKGKSLAKVHSTANINSDQSTPNVSFDASPFGQLISMLAFPFVRRSSMLTDKLLRLLSLISLGIPDTSGFGRKVLLEEQETPQDASTLISESHLRLIVKIITTKSCSEEGLEEATSLLLNLSYGPPSTRDRILSLLMEGVRELGNVVCGHIAGLMNELKAMNKDVHQDSRDGAEDSQSFADQEGTDKMFKGTLMDRFTKETVVITSGGKGKAPCELQLPSMAALTSKTSSQAFFLRLLKVIISLREAIRLAIKKHKGKAGGPNFSSTMVGALADGSLVSAVTVGINEQTSMRLREVFQRVAQAELANLQREEQPMDVDQESSMDGNESRVASSNPTDGAENASGTGSSTAGAQEQNKLSPSDADAKDVGNKVIFDESKLLPRLSSVLDLDSLWDTLSKCLLELGHTPDHHAVLVLQPAVEAFFLVHASHLEREDKKTTGVRESREQQLAHLQQDLPPVSPIIPSERPSSHQVDSEMVESHSNLSMLDSTQATAVPLKPDTQKFLNFAETHRTVLNQILRQSTSHLADGPFAVLVDHTRVLDFDVKRRYFRTELERLDEGVRREDLAVHVRRSNVFEDSFREFHRRTAEEWKNRFYIVFEGEEGQDAGGLLREWYVIISREIFNPMYALFTISPGDRVTYMINPSSHCNSNHLFYFKFVGRVIAKAIYDNKLLECYFTRSFYKHILGKSVKYIDMESEDYSFYQGLVFLMDNNVSELGYDLTFSTEVQEFGVTEVRDLIPNGRNIAVTEENKMEYIRLVCQMKMTGAIRKQLNAFLEGFYDIIPKRLISIFNEQELELLLSGLPNIDIEDLKANTEYHKYQPNSLQIQWFWRALRSFDQADRAKFLQFVTGTSKVPLQGFGSLEGMNGVQKFQIHRDDRSTDRLPSAHTCFNQLDLPAYETYDKLRTYLLKAIHECSEGFGFA